MRSLPLRLSPIDRESLLGYIARYSHTFQFEPGDVARALGLEPGADGVSAAARHGVSLSAEQLNHRRVRDRDPHRGARGNAALPVRRSRV